MNMKGSGLQRVRMWYDKWVGSLWIGGTYANLWPLLNCLTFFMCTNKLLLVSSHYFRDVYI